MASRYPELPLREGGLLEVRRQVLAPALAASDAADRLVRRTHDGAVALAALSALKRARSVAWDSFSILESAIAREMQGEGDPDAKFTVEVEGVGRCSATTGWVTVNTDVEALDTAIEMDAWYDSKTGERRDPEDAVRRAIQRTRAVWGISEFRSDEGPGPTPYDGYRKTFVKTELRLDPEAISDRERHPNRPRRVDVPPMPVKSPKPRPAELPEGGAA